MSAPMAWKVFRARLAAEGPIHIGWHHLGMIQRTRYYVPARAVWGALVAGMAPLLHGNEGVDPMYARTQEDLGRWLRFTPFFACDGVEVLRPRYVEEGLYYGRHTVGEFERRHVASQTSTALAAHSLSAEEGALHESEYLKPYRGTRLEFEGYLLIRRELAVDSVRMALERCAVGADRRYGWGRLRLSANGLSEADRVFGVFTALQTDTSDAEGCDVAVEPAEAAYEIPAHVVWSESLGEFEGELEVVSGRDWSGGGSGQRLPTARLCWAPGSRPRANGTKLRFAVDSKGMWFVLGKEPTTGNKM